MSSAVTHVALLALLAIAACDRSNDAKKAEGGDAAKAKVADAPPAEKAADPAASPAPNTDAIGVPECDRFIEKFARCIAEKVPEAGRAGAQTAMEAMVKGFKDAAAGPSRDQLATTCQASADATKQSMSAMGCTW